MTSPLMRTRGHQLSVGGGAYQQPTWPGKGGGVKHLLWFLLSMSSEVSCGIRDMGGNSQRDTGVTGGQPQRESETENERERERETSRHWPPRGGHFGSMRVEPSEPTVIPGFPSLKGTFRSDLRGGV